MQLHHRSSSAARRAAFATLLLAALAACHSAGSFSGNVAGKSFTVQSAAFTTTTNALQFGDPNATTTSYPAAAVLLSDTNDACADATAKALSPHKSYLAAVLVDLNSGAAIGAGSFVAIDPQNGTLPGDPLAEGPAVVSLWFGDAACHNSLTTAQSSATAGNVHLDNLDGTHANGTFTLTVGAQQDSISGSFDAKPCAALEAFLQVFEGTDPTPACK